MRVTAVKFHGDLWHQKTSVPELSCGFVCVILCLAILVEHPLMTDRQTQDHSIYCASIASCGKNYQFENQVASISYHIHISHLSDKLHCCL